MSLMDKLWLIFGIFLILGISIILVLCYWLDQESKDLHDKKLR
jgi:hypothetical protein